MHLVELFEDKRLVVGGDPEAVVSDLEANLPGTACERHLESFANRQQAMALRMSGSRRLSVEAGAVKKADDANLKPDIVSADPAASA